LGSPSTGLWKVKDVLSYDADGSGKGSAIKFASLAKNTVLAYDHFLLI
jgi:hypothetical protein